VELFLFWVVVTDGCSREIPLALGLACLNLAVTNSFPSPSGESGFCIAALDRVGWAGQVQIYRDGAGGILPDICGFGTAWLQHQPMYDGTSEPPAGSA